MQQTPSTTDAIDNIENDVEQVEQAPIPLGTLLNMYADQLTRKEDLQARVNDLDKAVQALIAKHLPEYDVVKGALETASLDLSLVRDEINLRAVQVEPQALKQYGGAVYLQTNKRVKHFDKDKAVEFIRKHPADAMQMGLVKFHVLPSDWQSAAVHNGNAIPKEIIEVEEVTETRIVEAKVRNFRTRDELTEV